MPLLYHWTRDNHQSDLDHGPAFELNSKNELLHSIDRGDVVWAFTRARNGDYVLAMKLVVQAKVKNHSSHPYGRFKVVGSEMLTEYFLTEGAPPVEPLLRGFPIAARARVLGQSFMGLAHVRKIDIMEHQALEVFSRGLERDLSIQEQEEQDLENAIVAADAASKPYITRLSTVSLPAQRREYLREAFVRDRGLVENLRQLYDDRCQLCGWKARPTYEEEVAEAHHLKWLSRGGPDEMLNLALLCPNHHRLVHACNAPFDFDSKAFVFADRQEPVRYNRHLI